MQFICQPPHIVRKVLNEQKTCIWESHLVRMCRRSHVSAFKNEKSYTELKLHMPTLQHTYAICHCGNSNKSSYEVLRRHKNGNETSSKRDDASKKKLSFLSIVYFVFVVLCVCGEKKKHWIYILAYIEYLILSCRVRT